MHILITGGTGFIGSHLIKALLAKNAQLTLYCRNTDKAKKRYDGKFANRVAIISQFDEIKEPVDAVINLAGEPIIDKRWSNERKQVLLDSRVGLTQKLIAWMSGLEQKPEVLISGSAIGFYGNYPEDQGLNESTLPRTCFPSELCQQWEFEALKAKSFGVRTCVVRTGIVLDQHAGALQKMWMPFSMGLGGRMASGRQWMSWIHIDDMVSALIFLLENKQVDGPVNATAPNPVTNTVFTKTLAATLSRPYWFPMPECVLNLLFGAAAQLLTEGQKVVPQKLTDSGFNFRFSELDKALLNIAKR